MDYIFNVRAKFDGKSEIQVKSAWHKLKTKMETDKAYAFNVPVNINTNTINVKELQKQLDNISRQVNFNVGNVGISNTNLESIKSEMQQIANTTGNVTQQVQQVQDGFSSLGHTVSSLFGKEKYRSFLEQLGLDETTIDKAVRDIDNLQLKINKITGVQTNAGGEQINKVAVDAVDKYGKLVTLTQTFSNEENKAVRSVVSVTDNIKQQEQAQAKVSKELEKQQSIYSDLKSKFDALYATQSGGKGKIDGLTFGSDGKMEPKDIEKATDALKNYSNAYNNGKQALENFGLALKNNNTNVQSHIDAINSAIRMMTAYGRVALQDQSGSLAFDAKNIEELKNTANAQLGAFEEKVKSSGLATEDLNKKILGLKNKLSEVKVSTDFTKFTDQFRTAKAEFDALEQSAKLGLQEMSNSEAMNKLLSYYNELIVKAKEYDGLLENISQDSKDHKDAFLNIAQSESRDNTSLKEATIHYKVISEEITKAISKRKEQEQIVQQQLKDERDLARLQTQQKSLGVDFTIASKDLDNLVKQVKELNVDESQLTYTTSDLVSEFDKIANKSDLSIFNKMLAQATQEIREQVKLQEQAEKAESERINNQAKQTRLGVDFTNVSKSFEDLQKKIRDLNIDESQLTYTTADLVAAYDKISDNTSLGTFNAMLRQATQEAANQEREINKSNKSLQDQEKEWQKLTDLINKAYGEATNTNTNGKAIQDPATIKLLRDQYDAVVVAVNEVRNATTDTFDQSKKFAEQAIQAFIEYSKVLQNSEQSIQATDNAIKKLQTDTSKGLFAQNSGNSEVVQLQQDIKALSDQYAQLQSRFQNEGATQEVIAGFTQLDNQIKSTSERAKELQSSLKSAKDAAALEDRKSNLNNKIETWLRNNTRASESMRQSMKSLQTQIQSADEQTLTHLTQQFNELNRTAQQTGQIGKSALDIFKEKAAKFAGWFGLANAFMMITNEAKQALVTLKDVDSILTEISKTSERSAESLEKLGETAFDAASKYGVSVQNYLTGVQEMARAGYEVYGEERSAELAELALLVQSAGDTTAQAAQEAIIATDAAFQLGGNVEELTKIFNGFNKITNNTAINMNDMAIGIKEAASIAHQYGVSIEDTASLIAIAEARTKQGGAQVGNAIKSLLVTLTDVTNSTVVKAFDAVDVSMYKFVDGSKQLKTPIELLGELSKVFNELPQGDDRRSILLNDIGGMQIYHYAQKCA